MAGVLPLSLFEQQNLAEITTDDYPGERLVICRNPLVADERGRKREALLIATEAQCAAWELKGDVAYFTDLIEAGTTADVYSINASRKIGYRV